MDHVVEPRHGHLAFLDRPLERFSEKLPPGISWSNPARTEFAVLCVAPQSDMTQPLKPHSFLSTSFNR